MSHTQSLTLVNRRAQRRVALALKGEALRPAPAPTVRAFMSGLVLAQFRATQAGVASGRAVRS